MLVPAPQPAPGVIDQYTPSTPALRITVANAWDPNNVDKTGDNAWLAGLPWGDGYRNELVGDKVHGSSMYAQQNDDMYYGWSTYIPTDFQAPDAARGGGGFLMQFHSVGECDSGGPNLGLTVRRTDSPTSFERGAGWQFAVYKRDQYNHDILSGDDLEVAPTRDVGYPGNYRMWPFNTNAAQNDNPYPQMTPLIQGQWYRFVMRVRWSTCNCAIGNSCGPADITCAPGELPGLVEFWVNGNREYPAAADPILRPTLYKWPSEGAYLECSSTNTAPDCGRFYGACPNRQNENQSWAADRPMPVYLKVGYYRDPRRPYIDRVYNADFKIGRTYAAVAPGGF